MSNTKPVSGVSPLGKFYLATHSPALMFRAHHTFHQTVPHAVSDGWAPSRLSPTHPDAGGRTPISSTWGVAELG